MEVNSRISCQSGNTNPEESVVENGVPSQKIVAPSESISKEWSCKPFLLSHLHRRGSCREVDPGFPSDTNQKNTPRSYFGILYRRTVNMEPHTRGFEFVGLKALETPCPRRKYPKSINASSGQHAGLFGNLGREGHNSRRPLKRNCGSLPRPHKFFSARGQERPSPIQPSSRAGRKPGEHEHPIYIWARRTAASPKAGLVSTGDQQHRCLIT